MSIPYNERDLEGCSENSKLRITVNVLKQYQRDVLLLRKVVQEEIDYFDKLIADLPLGDTTMRQSLVQHHGARIARAREAMKMTSMEA
jgi:hypothetical protein